MHLNAIVVVAGSPGSGKTTLAKGLAVELGIPLISKDTIKEALFDPLGTGDLEWSQQLGQAAHAVMYAIAADVSSVVLESHFWPGISEAELTAIERPMVQVYCRCLPEVALDRYRRRAHSRDRHPGHLPEHQSEEAVGRWTKIVPQPLHLDTPLIEVDTTHPVDAQAVAREVRLVLEGLRA
jgi:predicted kinase